MKEISKKILKIISLVLAYFIFFTNVLPISAFAAEANTPKEEVVYVNLNPDGSVKEIDVVNIVELSQDGTIIDYGPYKSLRNMTTTDTINYTEDTINIESKKGKIYYEGRLDNNIIPWNIKITYYLNGQEIAPENLLGKNGNLIIQLDITKNNNCHSDFFNNYALQTTLTLNTEKFKNISATDATIANVGKNKQLTYTILPGKGINTKINADVTDFEMDPISINGIPLNLDIDIDDSDLKNEVNELNEALSSIDNGAKEIQNGTSDLKDKVENDLVNGSKELASGSQALHSGIGTLTDGAQQLNSGTYDLKNGISDLDNGINSLNSGINQVQAALETLNSQSGTLTNGSNSFKQALSQLQESLNNLSLSTDSLTQLTAASSELKSGIDELVTNAVLLQENINPESYKGIMAQNGLDIDELQTKNSQTIQTIETQVEQLNSQVKQMEEAGADTTAILAQVEQLNQIIQLLKANSGAIEGTTTYLASTNENINSYVEGIKTLQTSYSEFDSSIQTLVNNLSSLIGKLSELTTAVNTLNDEYSKLDNGINSYTQAVTQILSGYKAITDGSKQLVEGSKTLKAGTDNLYTGSNQLTVGLRSSYDASGQLESGMNSLGNGVNTLNSGANKLNDGAVTLKNGTNTLKNETLGLDSKIDQKIDAMINSITGNKNEIKSFVSDKNTNVKSVQFVIKTSKIEPLNNDNSTQQAQHELTFWQKFLKLFGMYKD